MAEETAAGTQGNTETPPPEQKPEKETLLGGGEQKEEVKTEEAPKPVPLTKADLKLPSEAAIDEAVLERTVTIASELGLSKEHAQKTLDFVNGEVAARMNALQESIKPGGAEWTKQVEAWEQQALSDAEIGGSPEKLKNSARLAQGVVKQFFPQNLRDWLHQSGVGSHPDLIRALTKIGKAMGESKFLVEGEVPAGGGREKTRAERMYPSHSTTE